MAAPVRIVLGVGLAALAMGLVSATAQQLPAVSGPNGKFSVEGGNYDDEGAGIALGSFALPVGHSFGLQADGAIGTIDDDVMGGGGLHLFTRDPSSYLLGAYGSYHTWDSIGIWRLAAEAELYLGRFSLSGLAGYESVDVPGTSNGLLVLTPDDKHFFGQTDLAYYITDDLKLHGGYRYLNESSFGAAGIEYLVRGYEVPMSLFAKTDFGDDDYTRVTGGLKIFLSDDPSKSLIDRHRQDDPENYTPVFPALATATALPQCSVSGSLVLSPANGQCICPAGTPFAGRKPIPSGGGGYSCQNV